MWLVAPQIPNSVREFLDRIGIEHSEIHEAQFRRVAERHDVKLDAEETCVPDTAQARHPRPTSGMPIYIEFSRRLVIFALWRGAKCSSILAVEKRQGRY
jgi:hypothetical protein